MLRKNTGIYRFLYTWWVLISTVWSPVNTYGRAFTAVPRVTLNLSIDSGISHKVHEYSRTLYATEDCVPFWDPGIPLWTEIEGACRHTYGH